MKPDKWARVKARDRMAEHGEDYRTALSKARRIITRRNQDPTIWLYAASVWGVVWSLSWTVS